jgi:Bacterial regulatory protein, Fis family
MGAVAVLRYPLPAAELRAAVAHALDPTRAIRPDDDAPALPPEPAQRAIPDESEWSVGEPPERPAMISESGACRCTCHTRPAERGDGRFIPGAMLVPAGAARSLEINRTTLYKKMKKYRLLEGETAGKVV